MSTSTIEAEEAELEQMISELNQLTDTNNVSEELGDQICCTARSVLSIFEDISNYRGRVNPLQNEAATACLNAVKLLHRTGHESLCEETVGYGVQIEEFTVEESQIASAQKAGTFNT